MPVLPRSTAVAAMFAAVASLSACSEEPPITSPPASTTSTGPRVVWDLGHRPLPEVPLPNDIATYPDRNSPTGLRVNASVLAPTGFEQQIRREFDELDGWGTYQGINVSFADDLDLGNIVRRHQRDDMAFPDDAIYLIDLQTGLPVPLDLGEGNFPFTRKPQDAVFANDPRAAEANLAFDTIYEDLNNDGILQPDEDTNFDGEMGRGNVYPAHAPATDALTGYWDATSRSLIVRPVLPLEENHHYAVVLTDRLVGRDGQPIRSAFPTVAHPAQAMQLAPLDGFIRAHPELYGNLHYAPGDNEAAGASRVAFAWTYTTQYTVSELFAARDGLNGRGPFSQLATITPRILSTQVNVGAGCTAEQTARPFVLGPEALRVLLNAIFELDDPGPIRRQAQLDSYRDVAYVVMGTFHAPYLLSSDTHDPDPHAHWQMNLRTREINHVADAEIPYILVVPKPRADRPQPYRTAVWLHGYGAGITEVLVSAGVLASNGIATISFDGPVHGLPNVRELSAAVTILRGSCVLGAANTILGHNRARDLNGDGVVDPAGDFWSAYVIHSRDNVRQYALETSQLIRGMREFGTVPAQTRVEREREGMPGQRETVNLPVDFNSDGRNDLAGDYDGDGTPDVGGPTGQFYTIGESLGGIMAEMMPGSDPDVRGSVAFAGGGGLSDVAIRSRQGGIKEAVHLRLMGPLVVGVPAANYATPRMGDRCTSDAQCPGLTPCMAGRCTQTQTSCSPGQISMRIQATDVTDVGELEFACANLDDAPASPNEGPSSIQPGDDVLVRNAANGVVRCARADSMGRFRVGIPADLPDNARRTGNRLIVSIYRGAVVSDYGTCAFRAGPIPLPRATVSNFRVVEGDCVRGCGHVPNDGVRLTLDSRMPGSFRLDPGAESFQPTYLRILPEHRNTLPLIATSEGLGLRRQSPEYRRFLTLAQALLDKGDPISFAPYVFLRRPPVEYTQPGRHAVLNVNTTGDQNVPLNTGNAFSRAAGLLPFLRADTAPPHLRDYTTPAPLFARYNSTPNRVLIDNFVLEGVNWLNRRPSALHQDYLFDSDDLDEGTDGFGEVELAVPLRLVRLARPATLSGANGLEAVWAPTLQPRWTPADDQVISGTLNYYVEATGHHSVDNPPRPDLPFDYTTYMYNVAGQWFASDCTDIYYRSHPDTHLCLENNTCPHLTIAR